MTRSITTTKVRSFLRETHDDLGLTLFGFFILSFSFSISVFVLGFWEFGLKPTFTQLGLF
ncbi:MAG TPA: hypothetical protein DIS62_03970 [Candidatus Kerfeldbacteria bacterium]|uniref:Uncharacterized protein n=1 Tax=Candidatus Uhrbacteria bacterium RIFCSPLOWO2_01_FULL_47_25 TaxID=1802402 RepID=A0A1F7URH8_9BACT|nr:MAG: hypothetical protein A2752_04105 [Candidatus Uhrbacteria bacterium RIFCSPHIGHO2_01_FULL_46_23]OGL69446.1 MAG: hypothetical protein A3D60_03175 [Candidatus Uhrbacteria bacterium RIFCSPHIGHO2_02_FULL_47_29]OGL75358.1 MAG: hypothetical protein A3E96_02495 [Candidatus Uhrbacteria bacterium RIFCSPHIGHO2_12_FULL_46_13]OGL80902.1 MAG: hypothetical protein A2936_05740 [Candidatus Uhrbacteria bacterium RIFCSPLOWO2_01_FULL_47_25]HCM68132.1 hypothetical protein [Candidatus Kerfeldbacteria bacteriu